MLDGVSGVARLEAFDARELPVKAVGYVRDFDPKAYVRPRKSLKVMARDTQLGVAAADLAMADAGLEAGAGDPERLGVTFGADVISVEMNDEALASYLACYVDGRFDFDRWGSNGMAAAYPLAFLRILPNMIPSHVAIALDARGPNNTLHQGDISSLLAIDEARRVIERGWADVMIAGGASSRVQPFDFIRGCLAEDLSKAACPPEAICRPFDAGRSGQVRGEGAAAMVLESRRHAEARGARILGRLLGASSAFERRPEGKPYCGCGLARALRGALREAGLETSDLGHVNAHGLSTQPEDRLEAAAIRDVCGDLPVTAPKSYFGNLGAASGAMEAAVSLLAIVNGAVPPTLNYANPDPQCPINVISRRPLHGAKPAALSVNFTPFGQSAAMVIAGA
jgi:3-oxoacyl-[acyl-carrier-protein] synthase II